MRRTPIKIGLMGACGLVIAVTGYAVADELKGYQSARLSFMERASMGSFSLCVQNQGNIAVRQGARDQRTIAMLAMYACETVLNEIAKSISKRVGNSVERRDIIIAMRLEAAIDVHNIAGRLITQRTIP